MFYCLGTKLLKDYAEPDMTILHENGLDEVFDEFQEEIEIFGNESSRVSLHRNNIDKSSNNYGYKLIDFCRLNSFYI